MNRKLLQAALVNGGLRSNTYSLEGPDDNPNEALCLRQDKDSWVVYYSERGLRTGERTFTTEGEACGYFLEKMTADPTTRKDWKSGFTIS
jgi:hypothetical protein